MSMGTLSSHGGKRRPMADINVTPMVDVMLVLLVIFMVVAPTLKEGFELTLPTAEAPEMISTEDAHEVVVNEKGRVVKPGTAKTEETYVSLNELVEDLKLYKAGREKAGKPVVVVVAGHKEARYQDIINTWNAIHKAGIVQVSFQVDTGAPPEASRP